jgi:hypothetical protein
MSIISSHEAPPASGNAIGAAARSRWSFGTFLARALVILIGIAVGWLIAVFIGLATGWIEIQIC